MWAPAGVAQWIERWPENQGVIGWIPIWFPFGAPACVADTSFWLLDNASLTDSHWPGLTPSFPPSLSPLSTND